MNDLNNKAAVVGYSSKLVDMYRMEWYATGALWSAVALSFAVNQLLGEPLLWGLLILSIVVALLVRLRVAVLSQWCREGQPGGEKLSSTRMVVAGVYMLQLFAATLLVDWKLSLPALLARSELRSNLDPLASMQDSLSPWLASNMGVVSCVMLVQLAGYVAWVLAGANHGINAVQSCRNVPA